MTERKKKCLKSSRLPEIEKQILLKNLEVSKLVHVKYANNAS